MPQLVIQALIKHLYSSLSSRKWLVSWRFLYLSCSFLTLHICLCCIHTAYGLPIPFYQPQSFPFPIQPKSLTMPGLGVHSPL